MHTVRGSAPPPELPAWPGIPGMECGCSRVTAALQGEGSRGAALHARVHTAARSRARMHTHTHAHICMHAHQHTPCKHTAGTKARGREAERIEKNRYTLQKKEIHRENEASGELPCP